MNNRIVTEGISGMWHYHLSDPKTFTRGLCGAKTMKTAIEAVDFGKSFGDHFPKRPTWCATCHELATQQQPVASAVRPSPHEISTGGNERSPHLGPDNLAGSSADVSHSGTWVPVASGAGFIKCSCGWASSVEDDKYMYDKSRYDARAAHEAHKADQKPDASV